MYRRRFLAASALAVVPLAGCLSSAAEPNALGEAYEHGPLTVNVPRVEEAETLVASHSTDAETFRRDGAVFVTPWIQIENGSGSAQSLPSPIGDIEIHHGDKRATYAGGRFDEIAIGEETYRTYRREYRDRNGSIAASGIIAGLGPVYRLPADFDPTEAFVQISVDRDDYLWTFAAEE